MRGRTLIWRPPQRETEVATVKARRTKYVHCLPLMQRPPRRDTELAAVEGRFQVYHPKLPTPSPMLVLDTFLPGIGALPKTRYMSSRLAAKTSLTPSPMLVLDTFLPGIGAPRIMRKALDIRSGMIQITMNQ